jgi:hypothetical protein
MLNIFLTIWYLISSGNLIDITENLTNSEISQIGYYQNTFLVISDNKLYYYSHNYSKWENIRVSFESEDKEINLHKINILDFGFYYNNMYVATDKGLLKSVDFGTTWQLIFPIYINSITINSSGNIFIITPIGIFVSQIHDKNFIKIAENENFISVKANNNTIYLISHDKLTIFENNIFNFKDIKDIVFYENEIYLITKENILIKQKDEFKKFTENICDLNKIIFLDDNNFILLKNGKIFIRHQEQKFLFSAINININSTRLIYLLPKIEFSFEKNSAFYYRITNDIDFYLTNSSGYYFSLVATWYFDQIFSNNDKLALIKAKQKILRQGVL